MARRRSVWLATSLFLGIILFALYQTSFQKLTGQEPIFRVHAPRPPLRRHVAIATVVGWHFEIYMSMASTVERVLGSSGSVHVYTPPEPFGYGFEELVTELGLYHGNISFMESFFRDIPAIDGMLSRRTIQA